MQTHTDTDVLNKWFTWIFFVAFLMHKQKTNTQIKIKDVLWTTRWSVRIHLVHYCLMLNVLFLSHRLPAVFSMINIYEPSLFHMLIHISYKCIVLIFCVHVFCQNIRATFSHEIAFYTIDILVKHLWPCLINELWTEDIVGC